jgi:hypothetical protein
MARFSQNQKENEKKRKMTKKFLKGTRMKRERNQ